MPTKRCPTGRTIHVDRIISVGRDGESGGAVIRLGREPRNGPTLKGVVQTADQRALAQRLR